MHFAMKLGDLNDLMVLGALAGAEMAMRDVGIDVNFPEAALRRPRRTFGKQLWQKRRHRPRKSASPRHIRRG